MSDKTKIEWATHTFNPWWGCVKVSPECDRCYAETWSKRVGYSDTGSKFPIWGSGTPRRFFGDEHWKEPLKWNRKAAETGEVARVFCLSMGDIMEDHSSLTPHRQAQFDLIEETGFLNWLLLTKRPHNFRKKIPAAWLLNPRKHVWLGTTVGCKSSLWRIEELRKTPAAIRFLSVEPLIEDLGALDLTGISWLIAGSESGPRARPAKEEWFRSIKDQCVAAGVPFFLKQYADERGRKIPTPVLDGQQWMQFPEL